jgi:carbon monoxide dehydrogenase subunit G
MAFRHRLVDRPPDTVWSLLADPEQYRSWVPGTVETSGRRGTWPEVGSELAYRVGVGRLTAEGRTVVRICEPPRQLELEACLGRAGSARIAIRLVPWGRDTLVIVDEHPLRGPGATLHFAPVEFLLHLRHRLLLARLAAAAEHTCAGRSEAEQSDAGRAANQAHARPRAATTHRTAAGGGRGG